MNNQNGGEIIKVDFCEGDCRSCNRFSFDEDERRLKVIKKKVTSHYIPPDIQAIKILMDKDNEKDDYMSMSDDELYREIKKLYIEIENDDKEK